MSIRKVLNGDKFEFSAEAYNAIADAQTELDGRGKMLSGMAGAGLPDGLVLVHNLESSALPVFCLAMIVAPVRDITTVNDALLFSDAPPAMAVDLTVESVQQPFAITQEPIPADGVGLARIVGVTPARIKITNSSHRFARPGANGILQSADAGPCRILSALTGDESYAVVQLGSGSCSGNTAVALQITGGDSAGRYPCDIYANGKGNAKTGTGYFEVIDGLFADTVPSGTWTVGDEALVSVTGGSD